MSSNLICGTRIRPRCAEHRLQLQQTFGNYEYSAEQKNCNGISRHEKHTEMVSHQRKRYFNLSRLSLMSMALGLIWIRMADCWRVFFFAIASNVKTRIHSQHQICIKLIRRTDDRASREQTLCSQTDEVESHFHNIHAKKIKIINNSPPTV